MKQTIDNLLTNWKTTSLGLTTILGVVIHLIFALRSGTATEGVWTATSVGIVTGIGLLAAGDASQGKKRVDDLADKAALAIESGDTAHLRNPTPPAKP